MDEVAVLSALGGQIRTRRKAIGLTQESLALIAGVDRSYYGAVERGERNVTFTMLCRISLALDCDVALLTGGIPSTLAR